jgi:tetratricopeptide (TPR) repeat protein
MKISLEKESTRHVSERYIAKSDPYIVMVSTPNGPGGLFERIEKEPEETCIYKRLLLDYTYGLERIYTGQEIEKAKASPSFEREYNLKYLGCIGNVFNSVDPKNVEALNNKGEVFRKLEKYEVAMTYFDKVLAIDPKNAKALHNKEISVNKLKT